MKIYQIFTRNYSNEGTFQEITKDLSRIKALNFDCIYLLPIHPIGQIDKKGSYGSPYSIKNYLDIDISYGTLDDFKNLINEAHRLDIKIIMDAVINHMSKDNIYKFTNPEWFFRNDENELCSSVKIWSDVTDIIYDENKNKDVKNLIDTMVLMFEYWLKIGVDGFRCDVASRIPDYVWKEIMNLRNVYPKSIWIAESFMISLNEKFNFLLTDNQLLNYFDYVYDYTLWKLFNNVIENKSDIENYLDQIRLQMIYNKGRYLRFLENHDTDRIITKLNIDDIIQFITFFIMLPDSFRPC